MAEIRIDYSKSSKKFIDKNQNLISLEEVQKLIIKAVKNILFSGQENIDLKRLVVYKPNHYRIRVHKIRIIFTILDGVITIASVKDIGFRGNIYKK